MVWEICEDDDTFNSYWSDCLESFGSNVIAIFQGGEQEMVSYGKTHHPFPFNGKYRQNDY